MYKTSAISDTIGPCCSKIGGAKTSTCVDNAGTMNNNGLGETEGEVDIVAKEKQIDTNSEIYYVIHPSENGTSITPDKINKTLILMSS